MQQATGLPPHCILPAQEPTATAFFRQAVILQPSAAMPQPLSSQRQSSVMFCHSSQGNHHDSCSCSTAYGLQPSQGFLPLPTHVGPPRILITPGLLELSPTTLFKYKIPPQWGQGNTPTLPLLLEAVSLQQAECKGARKMGTVFLAGPVAAGLGGDGFKLKGDLE